MPLVNWAAVATASPMGQQRYEAEIQRALLEVADGDWSFRTLRLAPLRSPLRNIRRYPAKGLARSSLPVARSIGAVVYRSRGLVHRFDLRLPAHAGREVITIHDLPPLRFGDEGALPRSAAAGARRARAIIVPSEFAKREVADLLLVDESKIRVIPYGVSSEYRDASPLSPQELHALGLRPPFLLHAAGATTRKNLGALAECWRLLASSYPDLTLVLAGPDDPRRNQAFAGLDRVHLTGRVDATTVAGLMKLATAVVVPSTYEGFGLPALEGMVCGTPVVAAKAGALPEVCRDAALLVEPTAEGLAGGIEAVLSRRDLAEDMVLRGHDRARDFSWQRAAEDTLRLYAQASSPRLSG